MEFLLRKNKKKFLPNHICVRKDEIRGRHMAIAALKDKQDS